MNVEITFPEPNLSRIAVNVDSKIPRDKPLIDLACQSMTWAKVHRTEDNGVIFEMDGSKPVPPLIDMILYCPQCHKQHIDKPESNTGWLNPPHRSHYCQYCNCIWRPADVATNGVESIQTRGKDDSWPLLDIDLRFVSER